MKPVFARYDTNNDGRISRLEYRAVITKLAESRAGTRGSEDPAQTDHDYHNLDANDDGYISFEEFTENECKNGR